jgi:hypothetical protein
LSLFNVLPDGCDNLFLPSAMSGSGHAALNLEGQKDLPTRI